VSKVLGASYGVREGKFLEWNTSVVMMQLYDIAFGGSENYATGGIDVKTPILSAHPTMQEIVGIVVVWHNVAGWIPYYNTATGKLMFFGQEPTNSTTGVIALSEMANNSTAINSKTVRVLVLGV
jgi:hypothetical protein